MKVLWKDTLLILSPETADEEATLGVWKDEHANHVLLVTTPGRGLALRDLGPQAEACAEPVAIRSRSDDPVARLISNFAATPFELDGRPYATVESFWQGLKFPREADRLRIAELSGPEAKKQGTAQGYDATITYEGQTISVGTFGHWQLMERACWAKFTQNADARAALLSTNNRPLTHRLRRDSRSIPGVIMCEIWMRIREKLRQRQGGKPRMQQGGT